MAAKNVNPQTDGRHGFHSDYESTHETELFMCVEENILLLIIKSIKSYNSI